MERRKRTKILKTNPEKVICGGIHFFVVLVYFFELFIILPRIYGHGFESPWKLAHVFTGLQLLYVPYQIVGRLALVIWKCLSGFTITKLKIYFKLYNCLFLLHHWNYVDLHAMQIINTDSWRINGCLTKLPYVTFSFVHVKFFLKTVKLDQMVFV